MKTNRPAPVNNHMRTRACTTCGWRGTYNLEQTGHTCLCCNQPVTVTVTTPATAPATAPARRPVVTHPYVSELE